MLAPLSTWDAVAVAVFVGVWVAYNSLFDGRFRRPDSINAQMIAVRDAWMVRLLGRDNRITDAQLVALSIRSATFFASTTVILIAALFGLLGSTAAGESQTVRLFVLFPGTSRALFEAKAFLLIAVFVYAFFKFTWAIRQFNYFAAVVGSAPIHAAAPADDTLARRMSLILSHAIWQFNAGVRAYYFAVAALAWFLGPFFFIAMTLAMVTVLVRRQLFSPTAHAIADHVQVLAVEATPPSSGDEPGGGRAGGRNGGRNGGAR